MVVWKSLPQNLILIRRVSPCRVICNDRLKRFIGFPILGVGVFLFPLPMKPAVIELLARL